MGQYLKRDESILFLLATNVTLLQVDPATDKDVVNGGITPEMIGKIIDVFFKQITNGQ